MTVSATTVAVLLQVSVGSVEDSFVELSPRQIANLGSPPVVSLERMAVPGKKNSGMRLLCEVRENAEVADDGCRLSAPTLKIIGSSVNECVRLLVLEKFQSAAGSTSAKPCDDLEERWAELKKREGLVEQLEQTLQKLSHERQWYKMQAESFRAELAAATEELDLVMEERQVAVSLYTKSRMVEEELMNLKLKFLSDGRAL